MLSKLYNWMFFIHLFLLLVDINGVLDRYRNFYKLEMAGVWDKSRPALLTEPLCFTVNIDIAAVIVLV